MVKFYLFYLVYAILIQPITIILGFILRWLWCPPKMKKEDLPENKISIEDMCKEREQTLDLNFLLDSGDCAKFLGMYSWASNKQDIWDLVMKLCDTKTNCFRRTPNIDDTDNDTIFSGDMLSGVMGAISDKYLSQSLTEEEKQILTNIWNHTSWDGWPMVFDHPTKGKDIFNRGCIWRPWRIFDTFDVIELLVWLCLGYKITSSKKYIVTYWYVLIFSFPMLMLSTHDASFWIGRVYALSAHNSHSQMLNVITGYRLSNAYIFKNLINRIMKRREDISPDMLALFHTYVKNIDDTQKEKLYELIYSTYIKGTKTVSEDDTAKFLSIDWPPSIAVRYKRPYPPSYRGNDYSDERAVNKGNLTSEEYRKQWSLDVVFPSLIYKKNQ